MLDAELEGRLEERDSVFGDELFEGDEEGGLEGGGALDVGQPSGESKSIAIEEEV